MTSLRGRVHAGLTNELAAHKATCILYIYMLCWIASRRLPIPIRRWRRGSVSALSIDETDSLPSKVGIFLANPVFAARGEKINIYSIFHRHGRMRHMCGDE